MKQNRTLYLVVVANLTALSVLFYFTLKFPLPIFPSFLDIQFSNLPAIIGGFIMGPLAGSLIVVVRTIIKLPFSSTAMVGELIDMIIGVSTVLVSSLIYKKMHNKKGALIGSICGAFTWVVIATAANYFFMVDFYIELFFQGNTQGFVDIISVIPNVDITNYMEKFIVLAIIPFNILLSTIVYTITFLVYKRISDLIKELSNRIKNKQEL